jgi:hypothetical protein
MLVEDLSRLTRDTGELLRLYHRLRLEGIDIVGVSTELNVRPLRRHRRFHRPGCTPAQPACTELLVSGGS